MYRKLYTNRSKTELTHLMHLVFDPRVLKRLLFKG